MRIQPIAIAALLFGLCGSVQGQGLESEMNNMFGTMTNITDPQMSMGPRRGTITGGAYSMRGRYMDLGNLVTVEPPRFQAGCGGIDAYFGSMSWASKEQVVEMMRSIASNAVGYAFSLALNAACPDCDTQIKDYASRIQEYTGYLKDSCNAAKMMVNGKDNSGKAAIEAYGTRMGVALGTTDGQASDTFESEQTTTDGETSADRAARDTPEEFKDLVEMNAVWAALKAQPVDQWWGSSGGGALNEEIMSLTGSVVTCHLANSPGCGNGTTPPSETNGLVTYRLNPTLQLTDLVFGGTDGQSSRYSCNDEACYGPATMTFPFKGFNGKVEEMLFGSDGNSGLLAVLDDPNGNLTPEQRSFLVTTGPLGAAIVRVAKVDMGAAHQVASTLAPKIALDLAYAMSQRAIRTAALATSQQYGAVSSAMVGDLAARRTELMDQYRKMDDELKTNLWGLEYARTVVSFLPPMPSPDFLPTRGH